VRLPLALAPPEQPRKSSTPQAEPEKKRLRVVLVDDNKDAAETMAMLVRIWGHDVATASEGAAALELVDRYRPDVILLDIGLPGMNGYEVARKIREDERNRNVVLVAMTGYGQAEDRERSREAGFGVHLVKPVQPEVLQQLLAGIEPPRPPAPKVV